MPKTDKSDSENMNVKDLITAKEEAEEKISEALVTKIEAKADEREKTELLKKMGDTIAEYGGLENNIPIAHEYWGMANQYRALKNKE